MPESFPKSRLEEVAQLLLAHGVEFIVIGGQAELVYGGSRQTFDVDLCYRRTAGNLERLAEALRELKPSLRDAPPDLPFVMDARTLSLGNNFTLSTSIIDLDLFGWVEPIGDYEALAKRAARLEIGDLNLRVIALDDLIAVKRHIGRAKDQLSLMQLLAIKKAREEEGRT